MFCNFDMRQAVNKGKQDAAAVARVELTEAAAQAGAVFVAVQKVERFGVDGDVTEQGIVGGHLPAADARDIECGVAGDSE